MTTMLDILESACARHFTPRPPINHLIGTRYTLPDGAIWQLVAHNDLNIPYFSKVTRGKVGKRQYYVPILCSEIERQGREE